MLKFCLVIDSERFVSFGQINPRWNYLDKIKGKLNSMIKGLRYNYDGFDIVYRNVLENKFPATFMLVGKIFKPMQSPEFVDWGYHTYNHRPLTLLDDEKVKKEIKNTYKTKSFCPPLWMVESENNPDRIFKMLEKESYKRVIYKGKDKEHADKNNFAIKPLIRRGKLDLIHVSNTFEGNSSKEHMNLLFRDIICNLEKDAVYCVCTHDFTHKNSHNLLKLISFLKSLEKNKKIKINNIKNV